MAKLLEFKYKLSAPEIARFEEKRNSKDADRLQRSFVGFSHNPRRRRLSVSYGVDGNYVEDLDEKMEVSFVFVFDVR